jgi:hypothetical protein
VEISVLRKAHNKSLELTPGSIVALRDHLMGGAIQLKR